MSDAFKYGLLEVKELKVEPLTVKVRKDTMKVEEGCLSYVDWEDTKGHRTFTPLHRLEWFRYGVL